MNYYLEALQDEHLLLKAALDGYCADALLAARRIRSLFNEGIADRIVFCGMGSSLYAAYSVTAKLNNGGVRAEACNCYEVLHYARGRIDNRTILIMISQSGNTPEAVSLMEKKRHTAALTISMVNNEDGRLLGMSEMDILLKIGRETPVSNKTYYAQVAQLNLLAAAILGQELRTVAKKICDAIAWHGDYVSGQLENTGCLIQFMEDVNLTDLLGDDALLGTAMQAGLVLREMTLRNFCAHSLSDYSHGWFEIARPGYMMMLFADVIRENDNRMINFCLQHGGKVMVFSPQGLERKHERMLEVKLPRVDCELFPLYGIVPCYFMAGMLMVDGRKSYAASGN